MGDYAIWESALLSRVALMLSMRSISALNAWNRLENDSSKQSLLSLNC